MPGTPDRAAVTGEEPTLLAECDGPHGTVQVRALGSQRWLCFDDDAVQSRMDLDHPHRLLSPYTRAMMSFLLFRPPPSRVLMLGLGAGAVARFLDHHYPQTWMLALERNPQVLRLAREHFGPFPAGLQALVADARHPPLREARCADAVLLDVYAGGGMPDWTFDPAFHERWLNMLNPGGVLVVNLMVRREAPFLAFMRELRAAFAGRALCLTLDGYHNVVVLAFRDTPEYLELAALRRRAAALSPGHGIEYEHFVDTLAAVNLVHDEALVI